jgi:hypothetical protein
MKSSVIVVSYVASVGLWTEAAADLEHGYK